MITGKQIRMARVAVEWTAETLAKKAKVAVNTIRRIESGADSMVGTMGKIQSALESAGVEFIPENGGGVGVRMKKGEG